MERRLSPLPTRRVLVHSRQPWRIFFAPANSTSILRTYVPNITTTCAHDFSRDGVSEFRHRTSIFHLNPLMAAEKLPAHAVILAGGRGTRFWPRSRTRTPKQLLNIIGADSMLQQTVARLRPLIPPERIWTVTNAEQSASVRKHLPRPLANISSPNPSAAAPPRPSRWPPFTSATHAKQRRA